MLLQHSTYHSSHLISIFSPVAGGGVLIIPTPPAAVAAVLGLLPEAERLREDTREGMRGGRSSRLESCSSAGDSSAAQEARAAPEGTRTRAHTRWLDTHIIILYTYAYTYTHIYAYIYIHSFIHIFLFSPSSVSSDSAACVCSGAVAASVASLSPLLRRSIARRTPFCARLTASTTCMLRPRESTDAIGT